MTSPSPKQPCYTLFLSSRARQARYTCETRRSARTLGRRHRHTQTDTHTSINANCSALLPLGSGPSATGCAPASDALAALRPACAFNARCRRRRRRQGQSGRPEQSFSPNRRHAPEPQCVRCPRASLLAMPRLAGAQRHAAARSSVQATQRTTTGTAGPFNSKHAADVWPEAGPAKWARRQEICDHLLCATVPAACSMTADNASGARHRPALGRQVADAEYTVATE